MILQDLFEGRMKDIDIEYQDFLRSRGRNAMTDKQFQQAYGMTRTEWAKKNKEWTQQKERRPVAPDAHLFHEGAVKDLHTDLADKYRELAPSIEKYKDSFLAGQLYDALEAIAMEHSAELEFKRMMTGARNRAHMDYDTNPGGFQNWFWYLPFADENITEESQDDRNARIIAGEIEDAMSLGNEKVAQEKIKELIRVGYTLDKQGKLQRMGMYEADVAEGISDQVLSQIKNKLMSLVQLPIIKKLMTLVEPYKNQVLQIHNQAKKMKSQGSSSSEIKQFLQNNIKSIGSQIANNTLLNETEEFTQEEMARLHKLVSRQQWLTYLPLLATYIYDQLNLTNVWGDRGVYWWAYAWWIVIAIFNEIDIRAKKKKLNAIGAKDPDQDLLSRLDKIKEQELQEEQDACYRKVKSRYKVWPSAYASGALVQCRKKGVANWGNKSKK
jgi:hypothetical protein